MKESVIPTLEYKDEVYTDWYSCSECEKDKEKDLKVAHIVKWHKYCPICGKKINWEGARL